MCAGDTATTRLAVRNVFFSDRPWWPDSPALFGPLYRRASAIARAIMQDSAVLSPAGYSTPLTHGPEDHFVLVYYGGPDSVLVRDVSIPTDAVGNWFVDHAHLSEQLCEKLITR